MGETENSSESERSKPVPSLSTKPVPVLLLLFPLLFGSYYSCLVVISPKLDADYNSRLINWNLFSCFVAPRARQVVVVDDDEDAGQPSHAVHEAKFRAKSFVLQHTATVRSLMLSSL